MNEKEKEKIQKRKMNMRIFPICKALGWDYLFFYTANFLFLTQVKNISAADVILKDSFYALFGIFMEIPATFIIEYIGRKRSIVFANVLNSLYMVLIMISKNLFHLIIAEMLAALAFAIKETSEPAILNSSIPATKNKSKIFSKINQKGMTSYYILNAITTILAGFLYDINPYIPISLALTTTMIVTILSTRFEEIEEKRTKKIETQFNQLAEIKDSFIFILKSERLKALILFSAVTVGIFSILTTCQVSLLEELNIPAKYMCMVTSGLAISSAIGSKKQEKFHLKHKNKSLSTLMIFVVCSLLASGIFGIMSKKNIFFIIFIICSYLTINFYRGVFNPLIERYLRNFSNEKVDTKIFVAKNFLGSTLSAIIGVFTSILLDRMNTAYSMIIISLATLVLVLIISQYMKSRVGLKPEEYSKNELKYDELK